VLRAYGSTDKGPLRPTNQDCFGIDEHLGLCVLADGMGGHNAGEVAARMAVDAVTEYVRLAVLEGALRYDDMSWPFGYEPSLSRAGNLLRTAVLVANVQILDAAMSVDRYSGMGTTIVVTLVGDGRLSVAHVGDSRLYLFGPRLRQLTRDDSWTVRVLTGESCADPVLLQNHPMRNALTNVVGVGARTDVHVSEEELGGGARLVLTTDGVHGVLDEGRVEQLLEEVDIQAASRNLVAAALARGSRDNCTAVVADYHSM
jgi:serine/threonine protein phosphatase PrpC